MTADLAKRESSGTELRAAPRYELTAGDAIEVNVRINEQPEPLSGRIIDLSRGGAKITLPTTVAIHSEVLIEIKANSEAVASRAKVCWSRPYSKDQWWIGVAFERELPESEFSLLAANGVIERRRDKRVAHEASMTARWELGSDPIPIKLVDISAGGLRFSSQSGGKVGQRVLIETEDNAGLAIIAKVLWNRENEQHFEVGCSFVDKHGYRNLMQQLGLLRKVISLPKLPAYSSRQLVAMTVGVALVALIGVLVTGQPAAEAVGTWLLNISR